MTKEDIENLTEPEFYNENEKSWYFRTIKNLKKEISKFSNIEELIKETQKHLIENYESFDKYQYDCIENSIRYKEDILHFIKKYNLK